MQPGGVTVMAAFTVNGNDPDTIVSKPLEPLTAADYLAAQATDAAWASRDGQLFGAVVQNFQQMAPVLNLGAKIGNAAPYVAAAPLAALALPTVTAAANNPAVRYTVIKGLDLLTSFKEVEYVPGPPPEPPAQIEPYFPPDVPTGPPGPPVR